MTHRMSRLTEHVQGRLSLFYMAAAFIFIKTVIAQRFVFELPIEGWYQELIAIISPLSSVLLMLWLALMLARKRKNAALLLTSFITSFILFANAWYARFFNDFITIPVLFQARNAGDLGGSAVTLLHAGDILFFADFFVLLAIIKLRKPVQLAIRPAELSTVFAVAVIVFIVNLGLAETVRPELLTRTFDRNILVKSIGTYNYHVHDIVMSSRTKTQRAFATSATLADVENYVKEKPTTEPMPEAVDMFGIAKGKNVVLVSMESLQSFVINNTVFGQEITPFLNKLIKESFYFDEFYHQTGQGKTSDSEFIVENSLYALPSGAVFFTHPTNEYNATPKILGRHGYFTSVMHANDKTFWNRDIVYSGFGYDEFYDVASFNVTEHNSIGWGLKDIDFVQQSVDIMKDMPQPFYSKLITLTNHHPFTLAEEDQFIPQYDSGNNTVDRYFTTVRYMDEALKALFDEMKRSGLYEDTIFVMYGDHYGISNNHNTAMAKFLGKEITAYEQTQLQRVPFIIHIPGMQGRTISKIAGQIDIRPTLLYLLGIEGENELDFGENVFADNPESMIVLRDGSFITQSYVYTNNVCYRKGFIPAEADSLECEPYREMAVADLEHSDKIIYGDLMRFKEEVADVGEAADDADAEAGGVGGEVGEAGENNDAGRGVHADRDQADVDGDEPDDADSTATEGGSADYPVLPEPPDSESEPDHERYEQLRASLLRGHFDGYEKLAEIFMMK